MKPTKCRAKQEKIMQEERNKRKRKKKGKRKGRHYCVTFKTQKLS